MAGLNLNHIYKVYPNGAKAVNDFDMEIKDKEFIVFVGPSGCGKSTTLRMIAGLEIITSGELTIDGKVMNDVEPKDRDIAMVFQNYALYPHMTVYDNMAFPLRMKKVLREVKDKDTGETVLDKDGKPVMKLVKYSKEEIDRRVRESAEILGITDYLERKPKAMSGGQRQRVALGRALVREPKVFLLDEPLSNLDAKLRTSMRSEISKLHKKLQTTFIYVTHDQLEAMTMGTRIVVMRAGCIMQIDTPTNLYRFPENKFVAGFIGTPQMNFYTATLELKGDKVAVKFEGSDDVSLVDKKYFAKTDKNFLDGKKKVIFGIRPEHVSVETEGKELVVRCCVSSLEELGSTNQIYADINLGMDDKSIAESPTKVIFQVSNETYRKPGDIIKIAFDPRQMHLFDAETEHTISPRIPTGAKVSATVEGGKLAMLGGEAALPAAISLSDGSYFVDIPTEAMSVGEKYKASVESEEDVKGTRLARLNVSGDIIYLPIGQEDDVTGIDVDLKLCTFEKDGKIAKAAIPSVSRLTGRLVREKMPKGELNLEDGADPEAITKEDKKNRSYKYHFDVCGVALECPYSFACKILAGGGKDILESDLSIYVSLTAATLADEGLSGKVEGFYDYGDKKYVKVMVGEEEIYMEVPAGFSKSEVTFRLKNEEISVYGKVHDIRFI